MVGTRKRAAIVSSFTDEGTGKSYRAGTKRMIEAGPFGNYLAAGLVTEAPPRRPRKPKPARGTTA